MDVNTTAHSISDFGMLATTAAFFLSLSAILMVTCFKWFRSIINKLIADNDNNIGTLLEETRSQNSMLADISEGLRQSTLIKIKNHASIYFKYSEEHVCHLISQVIKENNIEDRKGTRNKIKSLLLNIHYDRNNRFDYDTYKGKPLSSYTDKVWVDWVFEVFEKEVYAKTHNEERTRTNVKAAYDRIEIDFYNKRV